MKTKTVISSKLKPSVVIASNVKAKAVESKKVKPSDILSSKVNVSIGITIKNTQAVANELSKILADEYVIYTKTRNAHWNVTGADFYEKHKIFETQFGQIDEFIDKVAERIRIIGHFAPATLKSFLQLTHLTEMSREKNDSHGFIKELVADHETIIIKLRENIHCFAIDFKDAGSSDFITGLMEEHEKIAWFLRSHLQ